MQAYEDIAVAEFDGVGDAVPSLWEEHGVILIHGLLYGRGIIRLSVADGTVFSDADPSRHVRKGRNRTGEYRRKSLGGDPADDLIRRIPAHLLHYEAVDELADYVRLVPHGIVLAYFRERNRHGDVPAMDVEHVELVGLPFLARHDDAGSDVLEVAVLKEEAVSHVLFAQDRDRRALDFHVYDGKAGVPGQDRSFLLPLEICVHHGYGPAGRRDIGTDAVTCPEELYVLQFVAGIVQAGEAVTAVDGNMADDSVLGEMRAEGNGHGITLLDAEIDVGDAAIEGSGAGVHHPFRVGDDAAGKPHHRRLLLVESRGIPPEDDLGAFLAIPDDTDGARDVNGPGHAVFALGKVQGTESPLLLDGVEGGLQRIADIELAVGTDAEVLLREEDSAGIIELPGKHRDPCTGREGAKDRKAQKQRKDFSHNMLGCQFYTIRHTSPPFSCNWRLYPPSGLCPHGIAR